jgi:hypothetical protein
MKMTAFLNGSSCSQVEVYRRFRGDEYLNEEINVVTYICRLFLFVKSTFFFAAYEEKVGTKMYCKTRGKYFVTQKF